MIVRLQPAVREIDPETGTCYDGARRYIEAARIDPMQRSKIYAPNARRVCPKSPTIGSAPTSRSKYFGRRSAPLQAKNSTSPVSRSYIAPAILIAPDFSRSANTGLR